MPRKWVGVGFVLAIAAASAHAQVDSAVDARETVSHYCTGCHNDRARVAGLVLNPAGIGQDSAVWEKVVRKLRMRTMPPAGSPRPDEATYNRLTAWLETRLDHAAAANPNPGAPLLHRLNRTEYASVIEDLLGLKVDVASLLPPDDSAFGFDNNADLQGLSPVLLEGYLGAADRVSALALADPDTAAAAEIYHARQDLSQDQHIEGLPFGTVGGMAVEHTFPLDAEYEFRLSMFRNNLEIMRGIERPHQVELSIDGERIFLREIGGADDLAKMRNPTNGSDAIDARFRIRVPVKAGRHKVVATFIQKRGVGTLRLQPFVRSSVDTFEAAGRPHLDGISILGPYDVAHDGARPVKDLPSLETLARRAYRRPVTEADMSPLREFYERGKMANPKRGADGGMQMALRRLLASPAFLFRAETSPDSVPPGAVHPIDGVELASRLSFFLWSSIPDDALVTAGVHGELAKPAMLETTVRRMLADPRSARFVANFAGQWLQLRNLKNARPNSMIFPDFDDNLRNDYRRETEMLFASVLKEDRSVLDLLRADYTFLSERLARQYGVTGVYGSNFRQVSVTQEERKGLLGQGSILTVTSHADRTSPVVRGKWILENLLGAPPPAPPPEVPPLTDNSEGSPPKSLRARMELHRANAICAGCHKTMDPIGFSMENFDATGVWRTEDSGVPIDASGELADGTPVDGVVSLRNAILSRPEIFVSAVTEKLMIYALGRGLEPQDMPAVRRIVREAAPDNYRLPSLIMGVARSVPFQMRKKPV
jgi:cytochrome c553